MHYRNAIVGVALLSASTGVSAAVWSPGGEGGALENGLGTLWPFNVTSTFTIEIVPLGIGELAATVLDFDLSFGSTWKLTRPDGNILEQTISWAGSTSVPFDGTGWSLASTVSTDLAPVPLPATALLFPAGLGMLAMLRARRRCAGA